MRLAMVVFLLAGLAMGQKYSGPRPPKADVPYLKHASDLIVTETGEAKEEKGKKDEVTYVIAGASSPAKTPLAAPIFLMISDKIRPDTLQLYKMESRNGRRELTMSPKKPGRAIRVTVTKLSSDGVYQLEVG